jgi:hypothetical protein
MIVNYALNLEDVNVYTKKEIKVYRNPVLELLNNLWGLGTEME